MKLSLILTGSERHIEMTRFFESLLNQLTNAFIIEIIFINQGTFQPPLAELNAKGILFREIKTGPLPLSKARNIGLTAAGGEILAFPDDDCWYPEGVLADVMDYLQHKSDIDALCTCVYDPTTKLIYGDRPTTLNCQIDFDNLFKLPISVGIFVRRTAFKAAGFFFDERLGAGAPLGSGEETDLIYRLLKNKSIIEYRGSLKVYHPVPAYQHADIAKYYGYGRGFGFLNGSILRDGEYRTIKYLSYVIIRSIGGAILNFHRPIACRIYLNRLLGICRGLQQGIKNNVDY